MSFLKSKIIPIATFLTCMIVCLVLFFLYDIRLEIFFYMLLLCTFIALLFLLYSYLIYRRKMSLLHSVAEEPILRKELLPKAINPLEQEYISIIKATIDRSIKRLSEKDRGIHDAEIFYSMWVHQAKTPIAAMRVLIDTGAERELLLQELFKIEQYTDMVLSYVRLKSNNTDYVIKSADLQSIVKEVVKKYAQLFIQKNLKLEIFNVDIKVLTDEKWFAVALEQVISNAIKYSRNSVIEIYTKNNILSVKDYGSGISKEDLPRIFERGFTGINGRKGNWSTGLGLYMCQSILKKLGHSIDIKSEQGKGTEVFIDLNTYNLKTE